MSSNRTRSHTLLTIASAVLAIAVALFASACGGDSATGGGDAAKKSDKVPVGKTGTPDQLATMEEVCKGEDELTVGLAWGFAGNTWRKTTEAEFRDEAEKCPLIKKVLYTNGNLDVQKSIADVNSQVAQGVDVLVVFPDVGQAIMPALRKATQAGVVVMPAFVGENWPGEPGRDYYDITTESHAGWGREWAEWLVKVLDGKGNVVFLGGVGGNPNSAGGIAGVKEVLESHPDVKLLTPEPVATNWDPAKAQQAMAGLLTKHDKIDGVITDYGLTATGAFRAFKAADRPLVPTATLSMNSVACEYERLKDSNPGFEIMTLSSRPWMIRVALRRGVAVALGTSDPEPALFEMPVVEDSTAGGELAPKCDPSMPPDTDFDTQLGIDNLRALLEE